MRISFYLIECLSLKPNVKYQYVHSRLTKTYNLIKKEKFLYYPQAKQRKFKLKPIDTVLTRTQALYIELMYKIAVLLQG